MVVGKPVDRDLGERDDVIDTPRRLVVEERNELVESSPCSMSNKVTGSSRDVMF